MGGVGIDITPSHSVLLELTRSGAGYRLGRAAILPGMAFQPDAPASRGADGDLAAGLEAVPSALRRRGALASLSGRDVIYRVTEMGASDPDAIRALVHMEVDALTGGDTPMLASHQMVCAPEGSPMLLIAVTREALIEHHAATLRAAGLSTAGFTPGPIALYQCFLMSGDMTYEGVTLVANIGEETTDVILVSGGDLVAARTITFGVRNFVDALASNLGINAEQARETLFRRVNMRPGAVDDNVSGERTVAAAQDTAAQLFAQVNSAVTFARGQLRAPRLDAGRLLLCGSGAAIKGLREFLAHRTRKTVETLNPLEGVDTGKLDDAAAAQIAQYAAALAVPLGLAKIAADEREGSIVFRPPSALTRKTFFGRTVWQYAGILLLAPVLAFSLLMTSRHGEAAAAVKTRAAGDASTYNVHHLGLMDRPVRAGAETMEWFAAKSQLSRDIITAEQRLIELAEARRAGLDAVNLIADLIRKVDASGGEALSGQIIFRRAGLENLRDEKTGIEPCLMIEVFIEGGRDKPEDVYKKFRERLNKHPLVLEVAPSPLTAESDGSGHTASVKLRLKTAAAMLEEVSKKS